MNEFKPYKVVLKPEGLKALPESMKTWVAQGNPLFVIKEPTSKSAFVSTHENPIGHLCTFVAAQHCCRI